LLNGPIEGLDQVIEFNVIYLHKLLPVFLLPTGLTILLVAWGLLLSRKKLIASGLIFLWISSTPLFSDPLMAWVESPYQRISASEVEPADAVVVLSGGRVVAPGPLAISEWTDADRFDGGVELYKAGKAPWLVFTGGWVPWEGSAKPEGEVLKGYAEQLGVPPEQILISGVAQNTAEEAVAVKEALTQQFGTQQKQIKILLVTSAFHMQRSKTLFERAGFEVEPFAVDFQVSQAKEVSVLDFLPNADALKQTETAWRELYGRAFYALLKNQ
jgi:uncharacterized SAM-binding protein YcdF (DUF218 family)